jgi:ankyrin repeat protein
MSALMLAHGDEAIVTRLLSHGADVSLVTKEGLTIAHVAALPGWSAEVYQLLVNAGIDVNARDNRHRTPLLIAASSRNTKLVKILASLDTVDINATDELGRSALFFAADVGDEEAMQALLVAGIDPNHQTTHKGETAFLRVCARGLTVSDKTIKLFGIAGADIKQRNKAGLSSLDIILTREIDGETAAALRKAFPELKSHLQEARKSSKKHKHAHVQNK